MSQKLSKVKRTAVIKIFDWCREGSRLLSVGRPGVNQASSCRTESREQAIVVAKIRSQNRQLQAAGLHCVDSALLQQVRQRIVQVLCKLVVLELNRGWEHETLRLFHNLLLPVVAFFLRRSCACLQDAQVAQAVWSTTGEVLPQSMFERGNMGHREDYQT